MKRFSESKAGRQVSFRAHAALVRVCVLGISLPAHVAGTLEQRAR